MDEYITKIENLKYVNNYLLSKLEAYTGKTEANDSSELRSAIKKLQKSRMHRQLTELIEVYIAAADYKKALELIESANRKITINASLLEAKKARNILFERIDKLKAMVDSCSV